VLEDRVVVHILPQNGWRGGDFVGGRVFLHLEDYTEHLFKAAERIDRPSLSFWGFEEIVGARVQPLVRIFAGSASPASTGGRVP
jgi:hypothetical protein